MKKLPFIILSCLLFGSQGVRADDDPDHLWFFLNTTPYEKAISLEEIDKVTFGSTTVKVFANGKSTPELFNYNILLRMVFGGSPTTGIAPTVSPDGAISIRYDAAAEQVIVSGPRVVRSATVYSIQGLRLVSAGGSEEITLSLAGQPSGVYVVTADGVSRKFVKK